MEGRFASVGSVWTWGVALAPDADLNIVTREALEAMYDNEMRRRREAGDDTARTLTSTWKKKPKSAIEVKVRALMEKGAQFIAAPTLNEASRPTLAVGTRLVAKRYGGMRYYAVVKSETPAGKLRLQVYESAYVGGPKVFGAPSRYIRLNKFYTSPTLATFVPSMRPDTHPQYTGDFWRLETHGKYTDLLHDLAWTLEPADEGAGVAVEWVTQPSDHD